MTFKKNGVALGFIGRVGAVGNTTNYTTTGKIGGLGSQLRRSLNKGLGGRKMRAMMIALTGAAVGAASKAVSVQRIDAKSNFIGTGPSNNSIMLFGGARGDSTVAVQTGVTVAQDLTDFDTRIAQKSYPPAYPADKSGWRPGGIGRL